MKFPVSFRLLLVRARDESHSRHTVDNQRRDFKPEFHRSLSHKKMPREAKAFKVEVKFQEIDFIFERYPTFF